MAPGRKICIVPYVTKTMEAAAKGFIILITHFCAIFFPSFLKLLGKKNASITLFLFQPFFNSTHSPTLTPYCRGRIRGHRMKFYQQRTAKLSSSSFMCYCLFCWLFFFSNKYFRFKLICESIISIKNYV